MTAITVSTASRRVGNWQVADEIASGMRHVQQAKLDFGDDAQCALRADEEAGQIVAGGGLANAPSGADHASIGQRHGQAHRVLPHRAVADRVGAGGAGRAHAADGAGGGARIDGEEQAQITQMGVELVARDAGLDAAVHVGLTDLQHFGHARQVERNAAPHRGDMTFERGAAAPWHDRNPRCMAKCQEPGNFLRGLGERDRVRQHRRLGVLAMRMMLAQGGVRGDPIAQKSAGGVDDTGGTGGRCRVGHSRLLLRVGMGLASALADPDKGLSIWPARRLMRIGPARHVNRFAWQHAVGHHRVFRGQGGGSWASLKERSLW